MPIFESSSIERVALHYVGNKGSDESLILSSRPLLLSEQLQDLFVRYFLSPMKGEEYFHLSGEDSNDPSLNVVYQRVCRIFDNPDSLMDESKQIARHLYDASMHPNIKGGDLFVVYFNECLVNGQSTDAVGIFKSENKEQFLKVAYDDEQWSNKADDPTATATFKIDVDRGIDISKLDKGAIIFNIERDEGFVVSVVDATNRGTEAFYWRRMFLQLRQREDKFYKTNSEMQAYKNFVTEELPQQFDGVTKADQADMLHRSVEYFKENESFDVRQFAEKVIAQPEVIESFNNYRQQWQEDNQVVLDDNFDIDDSAVKKQSRSMKSVIKLDKNFHIYVHGDRNLIEQGEDERGRFYKVYYREES